MNEDETCVDEGPVWTGTAVMELLVRRTIEEHVGWAPERLAMEIVGLLTGTGWAPYGELTEW